MLEFEVIIGIIGSLLGAAIAFIAGSILAVISKRRKELVKKLRKEAEKEHKSALAREINEYSRHISDAQKSPALIVAIDNSASMATTDAEVRKEIEKISKALAGRISNIEKRLPEKDTIDKIASVNDAILATQLESLTETVKKIEEKTLSRWDIAKIVFQILAAVGLLVGIGLAIISHLLSQSGG
jgi:uncharacterized protein YeeX (DUF496 family)